MPYDIDIFLFTEANIAGFPNFGPTTLSSPSKFHPSISPTIYLPNSPATYPPYPLQQLTTKYQQHINEYNSYLPTSRQYA